MTNQEQYDMLWENAKKVETMKPQYIELLQTVRNDAYKLGYIDGKENAKADNAKAYEMLQSIVLNYNGGRNGGKKNTPGCKKTMMDRSKT